MDDLEQEVDKGTPVDDTGTLSTDKSEAIETPEQEEEELTDEQLEAEISRLKDEAEKEEDPKAKRHIEQEAGWKMKIVKEREKAKKLELENQQTAERIKGYEAKAIEEAFTKALDENYGLPYFEKLYSEDPEFANKVAQEKWKVSAKDLIFKTKKELAKNGDEALSKQVSEEEIRMSEREKIYHDLAIEQAQETFNSLDETEKLEAQSYFDDIVE